MFDPEMEEWPDDEGYCDYDVQCKFCKRHGFSWDCSDGPWKLLTRTGRVHKCFTKIKKIIVKGREVTIK